jgi:hypothetical protein
MDTSTPSAEPAKPRKSSWETIITTTPVVLTVMATLLAGLSSSEMTLSMYFRSVAAQNQSKVGDQWAFFQAKRIRGTTVEMQVGLLPVFARPGALQPAMLEAASRLLAVRLRRAEQEIAALLKSLEANGPDSETLRSALEMFHHTARQKADQAEKNARALDEELKKDDVRAAFAYLGTSSQPKIEEKKYTDEQLTAAIEQIEQRRTERDLAPVVLRVSDETLQLALAAALDNASAFDRAGDRVGEALRSTARLVSQQGSLAAQFYQASLQFESTAGGLTVRGGNGAAASQSLAQVDGVRRAADDLIDLYGAAWNDFTARRYRQEGRYNQQLAQLYEVQVNKNSARSDVHRTRSKNFFFGMLGAQAGVAIASFALAARKKSVLWSLATAAGIGALIFSGYVYLYM